MFWSFDCIDGIVKCVSVCQRNITEGLDTNVWNDVIPCDPGIFLERPTTTIGIRCGQDSSSWMTLKYFCVEGIQDAVDIDFPEVQLEP